MTRRTPSPVGVRSTRQRAEITELLGRTHEFRTAQELHAELRESGSGVGLTTVYRTLQSMADAGIIDVLRNDSGEALYRWCTDGHHHHLVCRDCGTTVEIEAPSIEESTAALAATHGFTDVAHVFELFGRCRDCTAAADDDSARA